MTQPLLVADAAARLLVEHEASPARIELLGAMLVKVCERFGAQPLAALDPADVAAWRRGLPPATRWQATQALKQLTGWAVRSGLVDEDPLRGVRNPQPRRREFTPLDSWTQVEAISDELPGPLALLPWIGAGCGLRPGELLGLRWGDVEPSRRELQVVRSVWRGELRSELKTRRSRRVVPVRARVLEQIELHRPAGASGDGLLFATASGAPLDLANVRRCWRRAVRDADLQPRRVYDLRHTYATWSLRAGVSIFQLARRMGTSVDMIDATYGHLAADAGEYERGLLDRWDDG